MRTDNTEYLFVTLNGESQWRQTDVGRSFRRYKDLSGIKKKSFALIILTLIRQDFTASMSASELLIYLAQLLELHQFNQQMQLVQ